MTFNIFFKEENKKSSMQIFLKAHGNLLSDLKECKDHKEAEAFNETNLVIEERKSSF